MYMSTTFIIAAGLCLAFLGAGCGTSVQQAYVEDPANKSEVTGVWTGTWIADGAPQGMPLTITCLQTEPGIWKATFDAVCGRDASFTFDIVGELDGDKVVFEADVDLGPENGGQYWWRGEVDSEQFLGKYKNSTYNGTFELTKDPSKQGASAEVSPPASADLAATPSP